MVRCWGLSCRGREVLSFAGATPYGLLHCSHLGSLDVESRARDLHRPPRLCQAGSCFGEREQRAGGSGVRRCRAGDLPGSGTLADLALVGYVTTPDADPVYLYCDVLIAIVPERGLNNGMPSNHAPLIASAAIRSGEHVVHVGAGTGYYTAIMAHLAESGGRVTAVEFDSALAQRALLAIQTLLSSMATVRPRRDLRNCPRCSPPKGWVARRDKIVPH